ncbi:MAG: substrate-binding domain-containing protein [Planctomycetes bacterium]|nr:substrate-binding domain-containing protein [Planctomycetota bacterium]
MPYPRILLVLAGLWVSACGGEPQPSGPRRFVIGFSQCTVTEPWRVLFNEKLEQASRRHPDVELRILNASDRTEEQVAQMKAFIRQKVDAILISPKEAAGLTRVVREATEAGIPVVVLDRDVHWDGYAAFVGGDNLEIGRAAGRHAVKLLGGAGRARGVVYEICGGLASTPAQQRRDGFHEIVEREPGIVLKGGLDGDWKKDRAHNLFQDALKTLPVVDIVYAHNDPMAHGAFLAARTAGREKAIRFLGIDGIPGEGCTWVKKGELTATFLYPTPGEQGLELALGLLQGRPPAAKRVSLPTATITAENVDDYLP